MTPYYFNNSFEFPNFSYENYDFPKLKRVTNEDTGERFYTTEEGEKYPSVTTVLAAWPNPAIENWIKRVGEKTAENIRRESLNFGSLTHEILEIIFNNNFMKLNNEDYTPMKYGGSIEAAASLVSRIVNSGELGPILGLESSLYDDNLKVAGTLDCLAYYNGKLTVFDFKTTRKNLNIRVEHLIQCAAYSTMFSNYSGISVEQIAVAQVTKIGFNTQIKIEKPQNYFHLFEQKLKYYYKMKNDLNIR
jgi:genome maintenance exonuclease 1